MYEISKLPPAITLGYQGESLVRTIEVDCTDWLETYPGGTMAATILLPGYGGVAPLPVDMDGTVMRIPVTRGMTAKAGRGSINLRLLDGEVEKRSAVVPVYIQASHPPVSGEMPDIVADWVAAAQVKLGDVDHFVDETIDATEAANAAALRAENGEDAREQAEGLRVIAEQGRQDAYVIAEEARDGLYEAAEISRDEQFETAETTRNTQSGEATDRANAIAGTLEGIAPLWSDVDISVSALGEGAAPTASVTQDVGGTHLTVGIPKGDKGDKGDTGNVMYATFDIDFDTGELVMTIPDGYTGPTFSINDETGELEVSI